MQSVPTETTESCWADAMEAVSYGQNFACIPVMHNGEPCVFTSTLKLPEPQDEMDAVAHALVCCRQAHREAERFGAHPVD